uniref:Uncharacterized protein n=1 Tax=Leptobrachium leishanense TaxID=445787 RepID=A0A8C5LT31_9ANUR
MCSHFTSLRSVSRKTTVAPPPSVSDSQGAWSPTAHAVSLGPALSSPSTCHRQTQRQERGCHTHPYLNALQFGGMGSSSTNLPSGTHSPLDLQDSTLTSLEKHPEEGTPGCYLPFCDMFFGVEGTTWVPKGLIPVSQRGEVQKEPEQCPVIDSQGLHHELEYQTSLHMEDHSLEQMQTMVVGEVLKDIETACKLLNISAGTPPRPVTPVRPQEVELGYDRVQSFLDVLGHEDYIPFVQPLAQQFPQLSLDASSGTHTDRPCHRSNATCLSYIICSTSGTAPLYICTTDAGGRHAQQPASETDSVWPPVLTCLQKDPHTAYSRYQRRWTNL